MIPRLRRPPPLLVLAAAAAALASCGGEAGVNTPAPTASTPPPSVAPGALQPGSLLTGDTFTVRVPLDWSVKPTTTPASGGPQSATVRQTEIDSPGRDAAIVILEYPYSIFPAATLQDTLDNFVARVVQLPTGSASPQAVQPRTHITVAGEDAVVLAFQDVYKGTPGFSRFAVMRHANVVYVLTLGTKPTFAASYSPALDTLLHSWAWK
ncbi:MAG TPA: hypothetical protein VMU20_10515 [Candidatus Dormibacteraeota bacterium]|nr:hypothetical protein [Candidatus Dormibacteraeota bacterium]